MAMLLISILFGVLFELSAVLDTVKNKALRMPISWGWHTQTYAQLELVSYHGFQASLYRDIIFVCF